MAPAAAGSPGLATIELRIPASVVSNVDAALNGDRSRIRELPSPR
jgi:hypothetical protein